VGHQESCNGNEHLCRCHQDGKDSLSLSLSLFSPRLVPGGPVFQLSLPSVADTVVLEFQHYAPGSRWRQTTVGRKDHREKGDETDGFYGGIRKLHTKDEISTWRRFWPVDVLN
jgi:hypothetical protein